MFANILTSSTSGIEGIVISVETDVASSTLPSFCIVGLGDTAVRESKERIAASLRNAGFEFPHERVTVNLAPADIKKEGTGFDLPIAVSLLISSYQLYAGLPLNDVIIMGELSLSGSVKPIKGVLPMVASLAEKGYKKFIVPKENAAEAALAAQDITVLPAEDLTSVCEHIRAHREIRPYEKKPFLGKEAAGYLDMAQVKGHETVKRAMEIAAAGGHNMLLFGPPGSGKSMLAKRFSTILPDMTVSEQLEATKIYSVAGLLDNSDPLIKLRPFRSPHHSATPASLVGGGIYSRPGEVSYAHGGVLYLDEFALFPRQSLELLRQPIEDGTVTVSRLNSSLTYPSSFILLASMNPCPCGYLNDDRHECKCSQAMIDKYRSRVSGPILDRIDIISQVNVESYENLSMGVATQETSASIRERVVRAREFASKRMAGENVIFNSRLNVTQIEKYCTLGEKENALVKRAFDLYSLSARSCHRLLKLSRTIADIDSSDDIKCVHISEALQYRVADIF